MKKKIAAFIPFIIWLAFLLPAIHTVFFYAPIYSYDGSQGLFCCGLVPVENSFFKWGLKCYTERAVDKHPKIW